MNHKKLNIFARIDRYFNQRRLAKLRRCPKQQEINRLRKVLHEIADSRPDKFMDIEETPELTNWICDACHKARVGMYKRGDYPEGNYHCDDCGGVGGGYVCIHSLNNKDSR